MGEGQRRALADVHPAALGVVHDGGPAHEPGVDLLGVAGDAIVVRHDAKSEKTALQLE